MTYKAVGFDYGGVIFGQPGTVFTEAVVAALGIDRQTFADAYHQHYKKPNRDEVTWRMLWQLVLEDLGKLDKLEEVLRIDHEFYDFATINGPVLRLVDQLRAKGYKTGLLSNNSSSLLDSITQNGVITYFDAVDISGITGFVKPEREAFAHLAHELGFTLAELVYIDDSKNSLSTAEECGYTPVLFENTEKLVFDLTKLGLLG